MADFAEGSRDALTIVCYDDVAGVEELIDLTGKTVEMVYSIDNGPTIGPVSLIPRLPQTGDDLGKADYAWGDGELVAGTIEADFQIIGGDTLPHITPKSTYFTVSKSPPGE